MIVDLPNTTTNDVNKKITVLREEGGAITLGRVLTLVIAPDGADTVEDAIDAANFASREHPCRVIVVVPGDREAAEPRLDAQLRVGRDAGAGEVVVLADVRGTRRSRQQRRAAVPAGGHPGGGLVAGFRAGGPRAGPVGPVGDPSHHRRDRLRRPVGDDQGPVADLHSRAIPIWPGAASRTGARCSRRRWISRRSNRSTRRWCRALRRNRRSTSWRAGWPPGSKDRCSGRWAY